MSRAREITVTDADGDVYSGVIGTIRSTSLGPNDHGLFDAWLNIEWPGGGIGVGGYALDGKPEPGTRDRVSTAYGMDFIRQIIATVGVSSWEKIPGREVIVLFKEGSNGWGGMSLGIANIMDEKKVFILKKHADAWLEREPETV